MLQQITRLNVYVFLEATMPSHGGNHCAAGARKIDSLEFGFVSLSRRYSRAKSVRKVKTWQGFERNVCDVDFA